MDSVKEILESGALYQAVQRPTTAERNGMTIKHYVPVPSTIRLWCNDPTCMKIMEWDSQYSSHLWVEQIQMFNFSCRHSPKNSVTFVLYAKSVDTKTASVMLIGREPRAFQHMDPELLTALGEIGAVWYQTALEERSIGRGIGAVVYARRVIENEMDSLLQLLLQEVSEKATADQQQRVRELIGTTAFDRKASAADAILPASFFPGQQNAFATLHDLLSDGVHNLDDVESCERFDEIRDLFELLFLKLLRDAETRRLYEEKAKKLKPRERK